LRRSIADRQIENPIEDPTNDEPIGPIPRILDLGAEPSDQMAEQDDFPLPDDIDNPPTSKSKGEDNSTTGGPQPKRARYPLRGRKSTKRYSPHETETIPVQVTKKDLKQVEEFLLDNGSVFSGEQFNTGHIHMESTFEQDSCDRVSEDTTSTSSDRTITSENTIYQPVRIQQFLNDRAAEKSAAKSNHNLQQPFLPSQEIHQQHQPANNFIGPLPPPTNETVPLWRQNEPYIGCVEQLRDDDSIFKGRRLTDQELSMLVLMRMCDQYALPRNFLDELLSVLAKEMKTRNFRPKKAPKCETIRNKIKNTYGEEREPEFFRLTMPDANLLDTRDRDAIIYAKYCVKSAIKDLLHVRAIFGDLDNLVVNRHDPFSLYVSPEKHRDEVLDGKVYRDLKKAVVEKGFEEKFEFLIPLLVYLDKTGTDIYQRYPLEPIIFTLAIIRRIIRMHKFAWRAAGFMPELEGKSKASKAAANRRKPGATAARYHLCLRHIFEGFAEVEKEGIVMWLQLGQQFKRVRIRCPVILIIQDGKSKDMITNRKSSYGQKATRISAVCETPQTKCDNPEHKCRYILAKSIDEQVRIIQKSKDFMIDMKEAKKQAAKAKRPIDEIPDKEIEEISDPEQRRNLKLIKNMSEKRRKKKIQKMTKRIKDAEEMLNKRFCAHQIVNGLVEAGLEFGFDPRGVFGVSATDLMHAFQSGLLPYLVKMVMDILKPEKKARLDRLVDRVLADMRSGEKQDYPKCSFSKQFSNLTLITSDEWPGMLFTLLLAMRTEEGRQIFRGVFDDEDISLEGVVNKFLMNKVSTTADQIRRDTNVMMRTANMLDGLEEDSSVDPSFVEAASRASNSSGETEEAKEDVEDKVATAGSGVDSITTESSESAVSEGSLPTDEEEAEDTPDEAEELKRKCSLEDFIQLAEALLGFHAWYKVGYPYNEFDFDTVDASVRRLLAMLKLYTPRAKGNGWKIQKFHDMMHVALDMERYGAAANFDAGPGESMLKVFAKLYAKTAQKCGYLVFYKQVTLRAYEFETIEKAMLDNGLIPEFIVAIKKKEVAEAKRRQRMMAPRIGPPVEIRKDTEGKIIPEAKVSGAYFYVFADGSPSLWSSQLRQRRKARGAEAGLSAVPSLEAFLWAAARTPQEERDEASSDLFPPQEGQVRFPNLATGKKGPPEGKRYWKVYTECTLNTLDGRTLLRCHPNYRSQGVGYYDWVMGEFEPGEDDPIIPCGGSGYSSAYIPCKVMAFIQHPDDPNNVQAIVHCCHFRDQKTVEQYDSVFTSTWFTEWDQIDPRKHPRLPPNTVMPVLRVVSLDIIAHRCFVLQEDAILRENNLVDSTKFQRNLPYLRNQSDVVVNQVVLVKKRGQWCNDFV